MATTLQTEYSTTGDGSTTNYSFTFTYLKKADVKVTLDHVATTAYTFANASTISFTTAPASGVAIRIFRDTDVDAARFVFSSGSSLKAGELNENLDQLLYADQERASTDNIADQAVTTAKLRDGAVTTAKFANLSVTTAQLAASSVTTAKIAADAVNGTKIADNSINSEHYVDGSIDTAHIADAQVTTAKIADSAITETKLADNSVTSAKIVNGTIAAVDLATNSVTASKIASNAVVEAKILNGAVTTNKVADSAITSGKIADDTIVNADVNASAAIAGTKVSPDFGSQTITTTGNITVSGTVDGRDVSTDGTKLDGIESGATADQTAAEVRTLVGSATDSNVFTDAEKTKLTGISAGADVTSTKSINDLTDVNTSGVSDGKILKYQASSSSFIIADDTGGSTGATTFTGLTDTPANYGSAAGKVLNINAAGNAVEFNSNLTIDSSGNVGIGTSSPQRALVVSDAGTEGFEFYPGSSSGNNTVNHYNRSTASFVNIITTADQHIFGRADGEKVRIDSSGNLGVGTSSPAALLHLKSDTPYIRFEDDNDNQDWQIEARSFFGISDVTDNAFRLVIDGSGNVGLGTTSPSARLDVRRGDADGLIAELHQSGGYGINIKSSQSVATIQAEANQALTFETGSSATERLRIDASGNTLVGKTASTGVTAGCELRPAGMGVFTRASANPLQVRRLTNDGDLIEFYQDTGLIGSIGVQGTSLTVGMGGGEKLRIDSSGRLGLGTSSPQKRLHVSTSGSGIQEAQWLNNAQAVGAGVGSALAFTGTTSNNGLARVSGCFEGAATTNGGYLSFDTRAQTSGALTERMRIDSSGNVLLGTTTNYADGGADNLVIGNTSVSEQGITIGSSTSSQIRFADAGSNTAGYILYNHSDNALAFGVSSERMRIDSSGRLLVGTSSSRSNAVVASKLQIEGTGAESGLSIIRNSSGNSAYLQIGSTGGTSVGSTTASPGNTDFAQIVFSGSDGSAMKSGAYITAQVNQSGAWSSGDCPTALKFATTAAGASSPTERMRVDSDGRLLVGTTTEGAANEAENLTISDSGSVGVTIRSTNSTDGRIYFSDGTSGTSEYAGYQIYNHSSNAMIFGTNSIERMRIDSSGNFMVGKTASGGDNNGSELRGGSSNYAGLFTAHNHTPLFVNRKTNDGDLVLFRQDNNNEGSISVSGSTVSYNGAHLSRWSQLPGGAARTEILRGSVLSNLDEMCEWGEENNEQLNRMKVSDVEGDKNVSGVFQSWDDDDDTYVNDFYCAMTGDFVIRIAQGTTVARGDLLMSAGDGTAKPQDDDIVRSKTIAKVTSTTVSTTYSDNSYCVPCVLMAC